MSFDKSRFKGFSSGSRKGTLFHYTTTDSLATVVTPSYFNEAYEDVNDLSTVLVGCETGEMATLLIRRVGGALVVVSQISAAAASNVPVTAEKIGLPVDGTTNIATLLGSDMAVRSLAGGAVYELNPGSGLFYINSALEIPSNITLRMSGSDVLHGPNGQVVIKGQVSSSSTATLAANWAKDSDTGTVTTVPSWLVKNAWVVVEDNKVAGDVSGSSTERIRREIRQVLSVTSTTIVLNGPVRRLYETSYGAVLRRLVPVRNSSVHNWRPKFVEPASNSLIHTLMMDGAVDCNFTNCHVLNETEHGSRGNAFRVQLSYNSGLVSPIVRNPKYTDAGEG